LHRALELQGATQNANDPFWKTVSTALRSCDRRVYQKVALRRPGPDYRIFKRGSQAFDPIWQT